MSTFPLNAWYAAASDAEVGRQLLARTICNVKLVLYRTTENMPVALEDACWHRLLPLSLGRLEGDEVVCGYHGLVFNPEGRCTYMPSQPTINPSACVRAFPVVERHRLLWVWPGDPALADERLIPDLHWYDDPAWAGDGQRLGLACDYRLVLDNLMDLTHETFVHGNSIGQRAVAESPFEVTHGERHATVTRWMRDIEPPPFWAGQMRQARGWQGGRVDRWQIIRFEAPGTIALDVGVAPTEAKLQDPAEAATVGGVRGHVLNTLTPETERRCHYFWAFVRDYELGSQRLTTELRQGVARIFNEDVQVLERQQIAIDEHPGHDFYNLPIDAGTMWARRLIDQMIAAEAPAHRTIPLRPAA